jgi:hypothetical protein
MQDKERDLSSLDLLFDFGEAGFQVVHKEKLSLFLVLFTLVQNISKDMGFVFLVFLLISIIKFLQFLADLFVCLDIGADHIVAK